jgi:hypothetical protein
MEKVFDEVYPEELTLKKMDHVAVTVFTIFKFVPRKKNWAALPVVNTYF